MEKISYLMPDNTNESDDNSNELPKKDEKTISEVFQSLKGLSDDAKKALEKLDEIKDNPLPFLDPDSLKAGIADAKVNIEELFNEEGDRLAEKALALLEKTDEEEINRFAKRCGLSLDELGLKFPESSKDIHFDGWSRKTVNLETIEGGPSSVTADANVSVSLGVFPKIYSNFTMELETKPLVEERGPSIEFRIAGNTTNGDYNLDSAVISFMNTEEIYPNMDVLETKHIGGIVLKPDGGIFSVVVFEENGNSRHILSADADFNDSLKELEGVLGKYGIYVDCIPPVIDIAESFKNMARGHTGGESLVSVVPKNLFKYEGGLLKDDGERFDARKIWNLLEYDMRREIGKIDDFIEKDIKNPDSMLIIEYKSLESEMEIYASATNFLRGDRSPDSIKSFSSWISLSFSRETGGKDVTTTPEDDWHLSKTEQDLVKLFALLKSNLPDNL